MKYTKKIIKMFELLGKLEENKSFKQSTLLLLLPTLVFDALKNSNGNIILSHSLEMRKIICENLNNHHSQMFQEIFDNILIHTFEKQQLNYFQLQREELYYYNLFFNAYSFYDHCDELKHIALDTAKKLSKCYDDKVFYIYLDSL